MTWNGSGQIVPGLVVEDASYHIAEARPALLCMQMQTTWSMLFLTNPVSPGDPSTTKERFCGEMANRRIWK